MSEQLSITFTDDCLYIGNINPLSQQAIFDSEKKITVNTYKHPDNQRIHVVTLHHPDYSFPLQSLRESALIFPEDHFNSVHVDTYLKGLLLEYHALHRERISVLLTLPSP